MHKLRSQYVEYTCTEYMRRQACRCTMHRCTLLLPLLILLTAVACCTHLSPLSTDGYSEYHLEFWLLSQKTKEREKKKKENIKKIQKKKNIK